MQTQRANLDWTSLPERLKKPLDDVSWALTATYNTRLLRWVDTILGKVIQLDW